MAADSISFKLVGLERDSGAVTLQDLSRFIETFVNCLQRVEQRLTGEEPAVRHLVSEMHVGSAAVTAAPASPHRNPDLGRHVYVAFGQTVKALESDGSVHVPLLNDDLKAFRLLAAPIWNRRKRVEIAGTEITTRFISNIDARLRHETSSLGSVKGRVERLNIHNRHEFTLYPPIGEQAVKCLFPDNMFAKVHQSVGQTVTVHGLTFYRGEDPYPDRVTVHQIDIHPPADELPTLASLRGLMPNATDGLAAADFVERLRDVGQ